MTDSASYNKQFASYGNRMRRSAGGRISQIISDIFSPLLIPTYTYITMMWFTPMIVIPERVRMITVIIIAAITGAIPLAMILTLRRLGLISDNAISMRRQRVLPMAITTLCYLIAAYYLYHIKAPVWINRFFFGSAAACLIAALISSKWKISAHMTAVSGMAMQILYLCFKHMIIVSPMIVLTTVIMLCGIVGTSRIRLLRHTLMQVFAGALLGITVILAAQFI